MDSRLSVPFACHSAMGEGVTACLCMPVRAYAEQARFGLCQVRKLPVPI
jgi:enoyl-CoA hydratase/carnithine racemase